MAYEKIIVQHHGAVVVLKLNDPATLNAAGNDLLAELVDAFGKIRSGEIACRAVVLTGEGRGFCSGANLQARAGGIRPQDGGERLETVINPFMRALRDLPVPLVTAVNGPAAGVGCSLALMGDIIVCAESGYFLQAFRRVGLVPDGGSTWLLPRLIGKARAMEMMLLGDKIESHLALRWGLVNCVVADSVLMAEALELGRRLAEGPASVAMTRKLVWNALDLDFDAALDAERFGQRDAGLTADAAEGVAMFANVDNLSFVTGDHLEKIPLLRGILRKFGAIVVDSCGGPEARKALSDRAAEAHREGRRILIYPEGHLAAPGEKFRYRTGVFYMYRDFDLPVVPVATNLGCFWRQQRYEKTAGTATVEFLDPIPTGLDRAEFMARLEAACEGRSNELIAKATGQPVRDSVLVEWDEDRRVNVPPAP